MWSSSHLWKRYMSLWGSTFQASDAGPPRSSPFPRGPRWRRDLCLSHEHDTNALQYGRAWRQKGLAITGSGCALSHPIKKSGYPETDVLWRNHVVRPHSYAERSWRDAGWPGPCCQSFQLRHQMCERAASEMTPALSRLTAAPGDSEPYPPRRASPELPSHRNLERLEMIVVVPNH